MPEKLASARSCTTRKLLAVPALSRTPIPPSASSSQPGLSGALRRSLMSAFYSAACVFGPTMLSATRPAERWIAVTAPMVRGPASLSASASLRSYPRAKSAPWISATGMVVHSDVEKVSGSGRVAR
jgi:hypothetical protein